VRVSSSVGYSGFIVHSLDAKGRVAIPRPFLKPLVEESGSSEELALTYGTERRLYLVPFAHLATVFQALVASPFAAKKVADFQSFFFGTTQKFIADAQGRIVIPPHMIQYAAFGGEVTFVGAGNRVELWEPKAWEKHLAALQSQFSAQAREAYAQVVPPRGLPQPPEGSQ
jgi:MraZ protein